MIEIETSLFYIIIFLTVSSALLLIGVLILYLNLVRKYIVVQEARQKAEINEQEAVRQRMNEAYRKADAIVQESDNRAKVMLASTENVVNEIKQSLAREFEQISRGYDAYYKEIIDYVKNEATEVVQSTKKDISATFGEEIATIGKNLGEQFSQSSEDFRKNFEAAYKRLEDDLLTYKKQRMQQIEDTLLDVVNEVLTNSLSRQISKSEHQELVIHALEKAKKEGVI